MRQDLVHEAAASCDSGAQVNSSEAIALDRVVGGHYLRTDATQIANHPEQGGKRRTSQEHCIHQLPLRSHRPLRKGPQSGNWENLIPLQLCHKFPI